MSLAIPRSRDGSGPVRADYIFVEPLSAVTEEELVVECLRCGESRQFTPGPWRYEEAGACPRCQYVGWAFSSDLSERTRRLFRDLPLERRLRLRTL